MEMKSLAGADPCKEQALPWSCHKEQSLCVLVNVCEGRTDILGVTIPISFKEHQL